MPFTDKDGRLTGEAAAYNDKTAQFLGEVFNVGIAFPSYTNQDEIDLDIENDKNVLPGTVWLNTTINKLKVKTANGIPAEVIQSI